MEGGGDEIGPKRYQTRRLGPLVSFFSIIRFFLLLNNIVLHKRLKSTKCATGREKERRDNENGPKRHQTRCLGDR